MPKEKKVNIPEVVLKTIENLPRIVKRASDTAERMGGTQPAWHQIRYKEDKKNLKHWIKCLQHPKAECFPQFSGNLEEIKTELKKHKKKITTLARKIEKLP